MEINNMKKILIALFIVFLFAGSAGATEYYIRADGDNSDPDCSESSACCAGAMDISDHNSGSFSGDDIIYLCDDGGTMRAQLVPPSSGTSGHPITYINASGDTPILSGADETTDDWSETSGYSTVAEQATHSFTNLNLRNSTIQTYHSARWTATESFSTTRVKLWARREGNPSGNMFVVIFPDDGDGTPTWGSPSGQSDNVVIDAVTTDAAGEELTFDFSTPVALTQGTTYHFAAGGDFAISGTNYMHLHAAANAFTDFDLRYIYTPESSKSDYQIYIVVQKDIADVWEYTAATEPLVVLFDGTYGYQQASLAAVTEEYEWYYCDGCGDGDDNTLYVYSAQDPEDEYTSPGVEIAQRDKAMTTGDRSFINFEGIIFEGANQYGAFLWSEQDISGYTFTNCKFRYNGHFGITTHPDYQQDDVEIDNCEAYLNGAYGIIVGLKADNWNIHDCTVYNNGQIDGADPLDFGGGIKITGSNGGTDPTNCVVNGNTVYNNGKDTGGGTIASQKGTGIWIDLSTNTSGNYHTISRNIVYGNVNSGLYCEKSEYSTWFYNISYSNGDSGIYITDGTGEENADNNTFYNNVAYGNDIGIRINQGSGTLENNLFKNNISSGNTSYELTVENGADDATGLTLEYNNFGAEAADFIWWDADDDGDEDASELLDTYDAFITASSQNDNNAEGDPAFINAGSADFHLTLASPCVGGGTDVSLTSDYDSVAVPQNTTFDVGAFEFGPVPAATYDESGDLSLTATAIGQYVTLPTASAPMANTYWYVLEFDVANISDTWSVSDLDAGYDIGTISANGTDQKIVFQYLDASSGGLRLTADVATSSGDFDNFSLKRIPYRGYLSPSDYVNSATIPAQPVFESDGLRYAPSNVNYCEYSEDFTQWTNSNTTDALNLTGPDGILSATTLTASAGNGTLLYTISGAGATQSYDFSIWMKRITGTGNIDMTDNNGSNWTTKILTTSWQRFSVTRSQANPIVGIRIVTSGDAIGIWGAQLTNGAYEAPYIPTNGSQVSIAGETIQWTLTDALKAILSDAVGGATSEGTLVCDISTLVPSTAVGAQGVVSVSASGAGLAYVNATNNVTTYDGTNASVVPLTLSDITKIAVTWSKSGDELLIGRKTTSWAFDPTPGNYDGNFALGTYLTLGYGNTLIPFHIKNIRFFNRAIPTAVLEANF